MEAMFEYVSVLALFMSFGALFRAHQALTKAEEVEDELRGK